MLIFDFCGVLWIFSFFFFMNWLIFFFGPLEWTETSWLHNTHAPSHNRAGKWEDKLACLTANELNVDFSGGGEKKESWSKSDADRHDLVFVGKKKILRCSLFLCSARLRTRFWNGYTEWRNKKPSHSESRHPPTSALKKTVHPQSKTLSRGCTSSTVRRECKKFRFLESQGFHGLGCHQIKCNEPIYYFFSPRLFLCISARLQKMSCGPRLDFYQRGGDEIMTEPPPPPLSAALLISNESCVCPSSITLCHHRSW